MCANRSSAPLVGAELRTLRTLVAQELREIRTFAAMS